MWHRMTTAAQNANSTRELSKLSKEEQKEARKDNTGKHDANAGGWARAKKGKNDSEEEFQAPAYIRAEGATKPASLRSQKDKRSRPDFNLENYEDKGHKHLSSASEQGRQTHTTKRQKVREPPPSAIHYQDTTPASQIDYRSIPPQNEEDAQHIQRALAMTRANYLLRTGSECAPTARHQCYFHQVLELLDDFASHWSYPADSISLPDLVTSREPWRDGFGDWTVATGGDEGFVKGFLLELCGGRW